MSPITLIWKGTKVRNVVCSRLTTLTLRVATLQPIFATRENLSNEVIRDEVTGN